MKKGLGFVTVGRKEEVEKMRKGLSVIVGIAILLFAYSVSATDVVTSNLVSWWKFDETSGTTAEDSIGNNTGTVTGATWTTETAGVYSSGALSLDGSTTWVKTTTTGFNRTQGSWETWAVADNWGDGEYRSVFGDASSAAYLDMMKSKTSAQMQSVLQGVSVLCLSPAGYLTNGVWHHFVATWDFTGDEYKLYIDGVCLVTNTTDYTAPPVPTNAAIGSSLSGGSGNPSKWWDGLIDDTRTYDRVLTPSEVVQNYNAIPEPSTLLFLGAGLFGLLAFRRIKARG